MTVEGTVAGILHHKWSCNRLLYGCYALGDMDSMYFVFFFGDPELNSGLRVAAGYRNTRAGSRVEASFPQGGMDPAPGHSPHFQGSLSVGFVSSSLPLEALGSTVEKESGEDAPSRHPHMMARHRYRAPDGLTSGQGLQISMGDVRGWTLDERDDMQGVLKLIYI